MSSTKRKILKEKNPHKSTKDQDSTILKQQIISFRKFKSEF